MSPLGVPLDEFAAELEASQSAVPKCVRYRVERRLLAPHLESLASASERLDRTQICDYLLSLHDRVSIARTLFEASEIASSVGDGAIEQRLLERLIEDEAPAIRARAFERLGDLFESRGEGALAVQSWMACAEASDKAGADYASLCRAYERVLNVRPNDLEAADRLVRLHAEAGRWDCVPDVLGVVLRVDDARGAELVLRVEARALEAEALGELVSMTDEALALRAPTSELAHRLRRTKSRALAAGAETHEAGLASYRGLLEAFGSDADEAEYEALLTSQTTDEVEGMARKHRERRWLMGFRIARGGVPNEALLGWAQAEEDHGAIEEAMGIYRLLLDTSECDRETSLVRSLELLLRMARFDEALGPLAKLLAMAPPVPRAHEVGHGLLLDVGRRAAVASGLERIADVETPDGEARILEFLVAAREATSTMTDARRRWFRRIIELKSGQNDDLSLSFVLEGAAELPDELGLWITAERIGRARAELRSVVDAYGQAIMTRPMDTAVLTDLGRRMVALEDEAITQSTVVAAALETVLEAVPNARWALDRVKLALGTKGDWATLFRLYDRAVQSAGDDERLELLEEAALLARDLADDHERAIRYLALVHAAKRDDTSIALSLERLYELTARTVDLVALLEERRARGEPAVRPALSRRIVTLWLGAGVIEEAGRALESMLEEGVPAGSVTDLLEQVASHASQGRVRDRLCRHYESCGRFDDLVRIGQSALAFASDRSERARLVRELVRYRLVSEEGRFSSATPLVAADVGEFPATAKVAYRALLARALMSLECAATDDECDDAESGAVNAIAALCSIALESDDPIAAGRLLERGARLRLARFRQRELLHKAALVYADRVGTPSRAIRLLREIFEEDDDDTIARDLFERYVLLLEAEAQDMQLASLWEARSRRAENVALERAALERAGAHWEKSGDLRRAIDVFARGAKLDSVVSYEALGRIHAAQNVWREAAGAFEWLCARSSADLLGPRAILLARAYVQLGDTDRARACLERALACTDVTNAEEMRAQLFDLYRVGARWEALAEALETHAMSAAGPRVAARLREAAEVVETKLDDPLRAVRLLEAAAASNTADPDVRPMLARVLEKLGRWDRVAEVLEEQLAMLGHRRTASAATTHQKLALALSRLGRSAEALAQLRNAAQILPTDTGILRDLARHALQADDLATAEQAYRTLLLAIGRSTGAGLVNHEARAPEGRPESRIEIYLDLSAIAIRRGHQTKAVNLLESALDLALENDTNVLPIERGLREAGRHDLAVRATEWRVLHEPARVTRIMALRDLAKSWADHLGQEQELGNRIRCHAEDLGRALVSDRVQTREAWEALAAVFEQMAMRDALTDFMDRAIGELQAGDERASLLVMLARVLLAEPARPDDAIRALFSASREHSSQREDAVDLLATLLEREGRWGDLAGVLEERLRDLRERVPRDSRGLRTFDNTQPAYVHELFRLGRTLEKAGRKADAEVLYGSVLERGPRDVDTVRMLAERLDALKSDRLADCLELMTTFSSESGHLVASRLIELRDEQGDTAGLLRALELGSTADPANRAHLERLVSLYEVQGDVAAIVRTLERAPAVLADDRALLRKLVAAQRAMRAAAENLAFLDGALARCPGDAELLLMRAYARHEVGNDEGAVMDLESIGEIAAEHLDEVIDLLTVIVARSTSDPHALLLVDVLVRASRFEEAEWELARALARSPEHVGALERLASFALRDRDWDGVAAAYERLLRRLDATMAPDDGRWCRAVLGLADAHARAGRTEAAQGALERGLARHPEHDEMAARLERICQLTEDWARLSRLLVARAERTLDPTSKGRFLLRAATLMFERVNLPDEALRIVELARSANESDLEMALLGARIHMALGRPSDTLTLLGEALGHGRGRRSPLLANAYLESAKAHLALDELIEAMDMLKAGFAIDVRSHELAMLLGLVAIDLGEDKTAERALIAVTTFTGRSHGATDAATLRDRRTAMTHLASMAQGRGDLVRARHWTARAEAV